RRVVAPRRPRRCGDAPPLHRRRTAGDAGRRGPARLGRAGRRTHAAPRPRRGGARGRVVAARRRAGQRRRRTDGAEGGSGRGGGLGRQDGWVTTLRFPGEALLFSGGLDGSVRLWDPATGAETVVPVDGPALVPTVSAGGRRLAYVDNGNRIHVRELAGRSE